MSWLETTDALGRPVRLGAPPRRIVSLVPSQTELLADLDLDAEVVGLTRFCVHPEGWKARKPIVGGTKNVRLDRVRGLAPDLVIANQEENVREQVEALAEVVPVYVTDVGTVADALTMIRDVGRIVDRAPPADALAGEIAAGFDRLAADVGEPDAGETDDRPRALYLIWRDPWMTVGHDTIIHDVMRRAGLANVAADRDRYPALSDDEIHALDPDVVLLSSEPYPFAEAHRAEVQALAPRARIEFVDGEVFSWYGSRLRHTPGALWTLRQRLGTAAAPPST